MQIGKTGKQRIYIGVLGGIRRPLTSQKNVVRFSYLAIRVIKVMGKRRISTCL